MTQLKRDAFEKFETEVELKFQLYNSLFLSLPFHGIERTGALLTLFGQICETGYEKGETAISILDRFFAENTANRSEKDRIDMLFRFIQYAERQVVLFDALEDAAFGRLHDLTGSGTLKHLESEVIRAGRNEALVSRIGDFCVRLVLTAHPTQFYPGSVLGIINDLSDAIEANDASSAKLLLQQLGRTPFLKKEKPTPFDEAESLIWYLENVFYSSIGAILADLKRAFSEVPIETVNLVQMGFWSGGDRDGNPFVTVETTVRVAEALRRAAFRCYHLDLARLRRRLTFSGVEELLSALERRVYDCAFSDQTDSGITKDQILASLQEIGLVLQRDHNGLFLHLVEELIAKVESFGLHLASLDIRQDSSVHAEVIGAVAATSDALPEDYADLDEDRRIDSILGIEQAVDPDSLEDELHRDTLENMRAVKNIQRSNGEAACHRYIISHTQTALHIFEVFGLFLLSGWNREELSIDIVPLFETVEDLQNAASVMRKVYANGRYRSHLKQRGDKQTVMLGFSDGTKDGGYLMANYGIYRAKRELTEVAREFGIEVIFFDGRGGPPARGGGKTHRFYASMGSEISDKAIELTIQGQTVSSNFGTVDAARYNIEQMLHAGVYGSVVGKVGATFSEKEESLLKALAETSFEAYSALKTDPIFLNYLESVSPLKFYSRTNIGSRPAKRGGIDSRLTLDSLRAIPFVGAWSQIKQNVPGFYGVGTALEMIEKDGRIEEVKNLYSGNLFFKALIDNCEMAMQKSFFPLTAHLAEDPEFGPLWKLIRTEYERCRQYLVLITGRETFMSDFPIARQSVLMRERIVLPLATIQQYALNKIRSAGPENRDAYEKLVVRCSFGIINAGRNSA